MRFSISAIYHRLRPESKTGRLSLIVMFAGLSVTGVLLWLHHVPIQPTKQDITAAKIIMGKHFRATRPDRYPDQIAYIRQAQAAVAKVAAKHTPIPYNQTREPVDLLREREGLCYDRSRTIEKILRIAGFRVRHVSLYSISPKRAAAVKVWCLATDRTLRSHAVSECLTEKGWLVADSLHPWISVDRDGHPVGLADWNAKTVQWRDPPPEPVYHHPFIAVYGLYSRHGRFYPPFNPIPDINWGEFVQNTGINQN